MRRAIGVFGRGVVLCALLLMVRSSNAQQDYEPGHSIGKVSTEGNLIVVELDDGALGKTNLFDLTGRTLRFLPEGSQYRVETGPSAGIRITVLNSMERK